MTREKIREYQELYFKYEHFPESLTKSEWKKIAENRQLKLNLNPKNNGLQEAKKLRKEIQIKETF